ncbi:MAG: 3-phosphoshikimate 1-carboxyvinyltransferase [Clostridiales bacterium]|nr:3-phosphoshikimate 1-carboxyvinyltransferase [Clostridiales bacterium]
MIINKSHPLKGSITIPGDKSISHRAIMLGALAKGRTEVNNFLMGDDCLSTISCFKKLGISIDVDIVKQKVIIQGEGLDGLKCPDSILDVGNSGTTIRLLSGILCGQSFPSTITGDSSIQKRPMGRIIDPLVMMGADIRSIANNDCAPLQINSTCTLKTNNTSIQRDYQIDDTGKLKGIHYHSPVASAQVKSCVLLAGLYADGETQVTEPALSRNHTELMLSEFGAKISRFENTIRLEPRPFLTARNINIPGDISSAAYFIVAALIIPNSELLIKNVGINPTRDGILKVCHMMGADITLENIKYNGGEQSADILIRHSNLKGIEISGKIIPTLIDEIPIIAVLSCFAEGKTIIRDAEELKVKESNRIEEIVRNLSNMGADIIATDDGMIINGGRPLHGTVIDSKMDHRIAMAFTIAAMASHGSTTILNPECVNISYPYFYDVAKTVSDRYS